MLPTAKDIARVIVACARVTGENPLDVESRPGLRFRVYAFVILALEYPDAQRGGRKADSIRQWIGASYGFEATARTEITRGRWFDIATLNAIREERGFGAVSPQECLDATYEPHVTHSRKEPIVGASALEEKRGALIPVAAAKPLPPAVLPSERARAVESTKRGRALALRPGAELDRMPTRAEQIAFSGQQMIVVRGADEPPFERSALAERLLNPKEDPTTHEVKDGITLFTEGYNCGLHGNDQSFPETMLGMGLEYRTGWTQGFADRPLLKASAEEFAKAMERA